MGAREKEEREEKGKSQTIKVIVGHSRSGGNV